MNLAASAVVIDLGANAIRLVVPGLAGVVGGPGATMDGILDVGANGRLLGVEVGGDYVTVMDPPPGAEAHVRSASVTVGIAGTEPPEISIPRHGRGYEITYPSGNQCWQVTTVGGQLIQLCATTAGGSVGPGDGGGGTPGSRG